MLHVLKLSVSIRERKQSTYGEASVPDEIARFREVFHTLPNFRSGSEDLFERSMKVLADRRQGPTQKTERALIDGNAATRRIRNNAKNVRCHVDPLVSCQSGHSAIVALVS